MYSDIAKINNCSKFHRAPCVGIRHYPIASCRIAKQDKQRLTSCQGVDAVDDKPTIGKKITDSG